MMVPSPVLLLARDTPSSDTHPHFAGKQKEGADETALESPSNETRKGSWKTPEYSVKTRQLLKDS